MPSSPKNKIALVTPWFGEAIPGGAESETRALIDHLRAFFDIEVLTTCVKDFHSDWNHNFWKEGEYVEMDVPVRRFKVRPRDTLEFDAVNAKLMANQPISNDEAQTYIRESIRSENLNEYLRRSKDRYQWTIFIPYMFGITYDGILLTGSRSALIPCLHDESYAYLDIYKTMIAKAGKVLFHVPAEKKLAEKIFGENDGKFKLVGEGVDTSIHAQKGFFKKRFKIDAFILYAGRKDETKNVPQLIDFFHRYRQNEKSDLQLVLIGAGDLPIPPGEGILDLGFVSREDKFNAMADALCLCQPSLNESFSIVLMESWLLKTPVLVHKDCAVTRDHVLLSNGGLFYGDYSTFAECLDYYQTHAKDTQQMANQGRQYVLDHFTWDKVTENYLIALHD